MPYDPNTRRYTPDFGAQPSTQGWVDMGEDQPIDMGPAAGAFKQRFMQNRGAGDMSNPVMNQDMPEMMNGGMDGGGGSPVGGGLGGKIKGGLKSL